ncbi:Methionine gamma-lyase [Tetrabaena socialis]|uniref:Methionine gamma-lyase n=1 Tax=Tetrabaena socialis TaxID=47790 RepID=A0A2J8AJ01_9CHLO|nr:Methionine gamma-lyase [Tetrabaena socialis]|eukprot:PNH12499.1 Methionine gamma-lyase [Tetrabaena socialis]
MDLDPQDRLTAGRREFGEFGGVNASVEISTTFTVLDADTLSAIFTGDVGPEKGGCYVYGRAFNPTVRHLGRLLASMEGCEAAYPCSSGMAAISSALLAICNSGDHIVASNTCYGGTHALLKSFLPKKSAITCTFVDITDLAAVRVALDQHPGRTKVLYTESVSNPTLRVADLQALADLAHGAGAQLLVDNTFTPLIITPRRFGADVVIHSLTKFVSGASDIIAGVVCGTAAFVNSLMVRRRCISVLLLAGARPTMDPRVASELALRLPHLALRVQEHGRRAAAFAARLEALGAPVTYPGLPSHPQAALLAAQSNPGYGCGGLLGLDLGTPARANAFMERLQNRHGFGFMAVSLGYFDTLMSLSAASTSSELSDGDMAASGIGRGYVRISVGITGSLEERWRQLEEAYSFVAQLNPAAAVPYRAVKVRRRPCGGVEHLMSWPSLGSFGGTEEDASAAVAGAEAGGDDGDSALAAAAALPKVPSTSSIAAAAVGAEDGSAAPGRPPTGPGAPEPSVEAPPAASAGVMYGRSDSSRAPTEAKNGSDGGAATGGVRHGSVTPQLPALQEAPPPLSQLALEAGGARRLQDKAPQEAYCRGGPTCCPSLQGAVPASPGGERPTKIRRTASSEVHYVLQGAKA